MQNHTFKLTVPQPNDFAHTITRIGQVSDALVRLRDGQLGRVLRLGGTPRYVEISLSDNSQCEVSITGGTDKDEAEARRLVSHMLSLDTPVQEFYNHCRVNEPALLPIIDLLWGARMLRDADLFASVISTIISQQLNLKFAAELKRRLWNLTGEVITVGDDVFYADPTPEAMAALDYQQLREHQFSQRKAEYVIDFARLVADGKFDLESLVQMEDEAVIKYLSSVRGLGQWSAECVLLFALGRPNLLPAKDIGLQRAATAMWNLPARITEAELRARTEQWQPWSSWYTYYLWLSDGLRNDVKGHGRRYDEL